MFKFKLQPVLEHRRMTEDEAKRRFQLAQAALERARELERRIALDLAAGSEVVRQGQRRGMDMNLRALHENWLEGKRREAAAAAQSTLENAAVADALRAELVERTRGVKIIEKLRDHQRADWQREEDRREQAVFDEIAVREFNQRRGWEKDAGPAAAYMERNAS